MPSVYQVGQPFHVGRSRWPQCAQYNWRAGQHVLCLFLAHPSRREVDAVRREPCEFALLPYGDILFFLYRFANATGWSDAPYSWHLVQRHLPDEATIPETAILTENSHDLMQVFLVDADTGILRVIRVLTFSPAFTQEIRRAIRAQATHPWPGDREYDRQCAQAYRRYSTSQAMADAAIIRTMGGA